MERVDADSSSNGFRESEFSLRSVRNSPFKYFAVLFGSFPGPAGVRIASARADARIYVTEN